MRKPLTDIGNRATFDNLSKPAAHSVLLSGNMAPVKRAFVNALTKKNDTPIIQIALDNNSGSLTEARIDYSLNSSDGGYDVFASMNIREACLYLQNTAYEKNYADDQVVQIIKYLQLIGKINDYLGLGLTTIRYINSYFYKPDTIREALESLLRSGKITAEEHNRLTIDVLRSIKGQLILDSLLAETDFNHNNTYGNEQVFYPDLIRKGQIAVLDLTEYHGSYTENKCRRDVFYSIESCNNDITVLVDVGAADYSLAADFVSHMTGRRNCRLIVVIDDIFAQCADYDSVRRRFSYNLFGQHTGQSCRRLCECFHETERTETHYSRSTDSRIFADRFIDVLLHTNHSDTISTVPVRRRVIEEDEITALSDRSFIVLDNTGSTDYFSIQSI